VQSDFFSLGSVLRSFFGRKTAASALQKNEPAFSFMHEAAENWSHNPQT